MFKIDENGILEVQMPEGKTNEEIISLAKDEITSMSSQFFGKDIKVSGRITTHLSMFLGHILAHISKSVSLFDPKLNKFVLVISH